MKLTKLFKFAAAHRLNDYDGQCANVHGHTWKVEVTIEGNILQKNGILFDFKELKDIAGTQIDILDHAYLNDILPANPTAEHISIYLWELIETAFSYQVEKIKLVEIKVWESDTAYATYDGKQPEVKNG